jgi:hypothetical protein
MKPFTYDAESTHLSADDMAKFANIVATLCHLHIQHDVSQRLETCAHKWGDSGCDGLQLRARTMWKTAVIVKSTAAEEDALESN